MIVASGDTLEIDPHWLPGPPTNCMSGNARASLSEVEKAAMVDALERCHGKIYGPAGAAEALNLKPTTLYGKMRKLNIPKPARTR
jgi:formate hydrogenlyase transcriptional activator